MKEVHKYIISKELCVCSRSASCIRDDGRTCCIIMRVTLYIFPALSTALDLTSLFIPFIHAFPTPRWCFIKMHFRKLGNTIRIWLFIVFTFLHFILLEKE